MQTKSGSNLLTQGEPQKQQNQIKIFMTNLIKNIGFTNIISTTAVCKLQEDRASIL